MGRKESRSFPFHFIVTMQTLYKKKKKGGIEREAAGLQKKKKKKDNCQGKT